ncbi:hypothetical protein WDU94_006680 [Cyamophila willieti]
MVFVAESETSEKPVSGHSSRSQKQARNQCRGAVLALTAIVTHFGESLPDKLGKLWEMVTSQLTNAVNPECTDDKLVVGDTEAARSLVAALQVFEVIAPSIHPNLLTTLLSLQARLCLLLSHPYRAVRHMASRCLAALATLRPNTVMSTVLMEVVPLLAPSNGDTVRQHPPGYPMSPGGLAPCSLTSSPISPLFYEVASPSPSGFDFSPQHSYDSSNGLDQSMQTRHKNSRTRDHHISTTSDDDSFATVRSNRNKRYRRSQNHTQRPLQISNRYDALRNMDCVDDHEASEESPPKDKIPPIFVSKNNLPINDLMKSLKAIDPDFSAKDSRDFLRLDCSTTDGYRAACTLLDNKNLEYHSYRFQQDKTIDVVIKHVPVAFTDQEITDELQILGFKDFKLMRVWDREKKPIPVVSVYLDKKHEMNKEIFDLSKFMNCIVSVEPKKKSHHIPQCTKCQRYGHTKNYCKLSPRCLFCSLPHPSSQCEKKKEDTVKVCANCGENHTANFKGCTYYADLKKKRFRSTPQALHKRINSDPPPDFSPEKFPYLPSQRAPLLPVSQASDHMYARASQSPPVWNVRQSPPTWNTHSSPPVHNIISSPSAQPSQSPPTPSSDDASVPLLDSLLDTVLAALKPFFISLLSKIKPLIQNFIVQLLNGSA